MENMLHVVHVGKDKYHNTPIVIGDTEYRLYYKGLHDVLEYADSLIKDIENGYNVEKFMVQLASYLWIVEHKDTDTSNSKLAGIKSLSTCCLDNKFCLYRMQDCNSICSHCYAATQQERQHGLTDHNIINGVILRNVLFTIDVLQTLPLWQEKFFRIESFGDVENETQARNYIRLCKAFPETRFAAWTKNHNVWKKAFEKEGGKPANLSFIISSCYVNVEMDIPENMANDVNHVFTVYDKRAQADINCGGRKCMECLKAHKNCYYTDTEKQIREELK